MGFAAAVVGGLFIEMGEASGLSSGRVLRDVAASYDLPVLAGAVSFLGVMVLAICAAVTGFASTLVRERRLLLVVVSVFSIVLCFDDQFMLHEHGFKIATGLPEEVVYLAYALIGCLITFLLYQEIGLQRMAGQWPSLFFLALSIVADKEIFGDSSYATEDLLKLAGFAAWAAFWWVYSKNRLQLLGLAGGS